MPVLNKTHQKFVVIRFDRSRIDRRFVVDAVDWEE